MYQSNVPDKMSEKEFWDRYFKSRFIHGDRGAAKDNLFDECFVQEQGTSLSDIQGKIHTLVDVSATREDHESQLVNNAY